MQVQARITTFCLDILAETQNVSTFLDIISPSLSLTIIIIIIIIIICQLIVVDFYDVFLKNDCSYFTASDNNLSRIMSSAKKLQ